MHCLYLTGLIKLAYMQVFVYTNSYTDSKTTFSKSNCDQESSQNIKRIYGHKRDLKLYAIETFMIAKRNIDLHE